MYSPIPIPSLWLEVNEQLSSGFDRKRGDVVKILLTRVAPTELTEVALDELCSPARLVGEFGGLEP